MSFVRYFWLLFTSWNYSLGFFEARRFCVFPKDRKIINSMDLIQVCSEDVDERVGGVWRLNIQPAMTYEAPNRIVADMKSVRFRETPGKFCVWVPKYSSRLRVSYHLFPVSTVVFVRTRSERRHSDYTRVSTEELAKINP